MKRFLILTVLLFAGISQMYSQADNYKGFEWDIMKLGYAIPSGEGLSGGLTMGTEARYNLKDEISVGLRMELALFGGDSDSGNVDIGASGSYALMGDYYFNTESGNRPFAGLGLGLFAGGSVDITDEMGNVISGGDAGSGFGVIPRVGYELGHLRIAAEYNLALKEGLPNYIGISLGLTLWGGYNG